MGLIILAIAGIGFYFEIFLIWVCLVELIYVSFLKKKKKNIESAIFDLSSNKIDAKGAFCFQFFGSF